MARLINGELTISAYNPTANAGEYTITGAEYSNQADATGNGSNDIEVGFILYVPVADPNSGAGVPGHTNRYKITSVTQQGDGVAVDLTILYDQSTPQVDVPLNGASALLCEPTEDSKLASIPSSAIYPDLPAGSDIASLAEEARSRLDYLGSMFIKFMQNKTGTAIPGKTPVAKLPDGSIIPSDANGTSNNQAVMAITVNEIAPNAIGMVFLIAPNMAGAIAGLGFTPADKVFLSDVGGYTNDPGSLTSGGPDSIIRIGYADCASGAASSVATDLILFGEVMESSSAE